MAFESVHNVIGWTHKKGVVDGNNYDFVTIYAVSKLEQKENQRGAAGIEFRAEPHLVEKLSKVMFNVVVPMKLQIEQVATGKGVFKDVVVMAEPVPASPQQPKP
jgi:hypothetical protein